MKKEREALKKKIKKQLDKCAKELSDVEADKEKANAAAIEIQNDLLKLLETAKNKLPENCHPNNTMGYNELVDQALKQML